MSAISRGETSGAWRRGPIFGEDDSPPVLGAYTLEGLALAVDPLNQRLVPLPWLLRAECAPA